MREQTYAKRRLKVLFIWIIKAKLSTGKVGNCAHCDTGIECRS